MKVAFVAPRLDVGGFERQWSQLVPALVARGVTVELFTLDGTGPIFDELVRAGVPALQLAIRGRNDVLGAIRAAKAIASRAPDVVFSTGVSAFVVADLASRRGDAAHIVAIHSIREDPDAFTGRRRALVRLLAGNTTASVVVSTVQLDLARSLGLDPKRTVVIPNGVPTPLVQRERDAVRAELGLERAFIALLVAGLRREKRVDRFIEAVVAARDRVPHAFGLIAGGGPGLENVTTMCGAHRESVRVLGPRTDVGDLMHAADVVCLTSDAEALPLAVLEAMAVARPVLATNVGGVGDAVIDGATGLLVAPDAAAVADGLVRLAEDPARASDLGLNGRARQAQHFSLERMVSAHHELFRSVVDGNAREGSARA